MLSYSFARNEELEFFFFHLAFFPLRWIARFFLFFLLIQTADLN